jgi:signal transduction histidine kinase
VTVRETGEVVFETEPGLDGPFEWRAPLFDLLPPEDLARLAFAAGFLPGARSEPRGEVFGEGRSRSRRLGALAALLDRPAGWVIEVRPAEGSLDAALARARRGNAALSSGILLLLGFAAVALAVSARRAQETARRQLEFTATVSHELRTPLAAIRSLADNLADGIVRDPGQARLYGAQIAHQGERLTEMVELVLALSAQEAGRQPRSRRRVELAPLLQDARREALAGHPAARVELDLPEGLPAVVGDPSMLRRAVQNLVANALKHGGAPGAPPWAGVRAVSPPGRREVRIEVSDRGPGIPAVERKRLFEPFFRGERARAAQIPGAGLGLHLVRRVAEAHGGRVEVRSTAGQGSTFTLSLPAGEAAEEEA